MDRVAVFVDAGHLYAGGSAALSGSTKKRAEMTLDVSVLASLLAERARLISKLPLLRIYWYDGLVNGRLSTDQQILASSDNIKLRLGIVNSFGEQKGVDARIVTDLADLARNGAICEAVLVGGDEDLRIGVELAQERGVRVHLLTVESSNVSHLLREAADTTSQISKQEVSQFLNINPAPPVSTPRAAAPCAVKNETALALQAIGIGTTSLVDPAFPATGRVDFTTVVRAYLSNLSQAEKGALKVAMRAVSGVPGDHDRKILAQARDSVGRNLHPEESRKLRREVRNQVEACDATDRAEV
jgi:uncharacterized LabA/DUF88 family protein